MERHAIEPRRIVSLCPSITETLVALGGLARLVGVTRFCARPRGMLWKIPKIGGTKNPDISRILDLAPDLVFANEEENRWEDVRSLEAAGIPVDVSFPRTVSEVPGAIRQWGARLGSEADAQELAGRIERELSELESTPPRARFVYAYWIWKEPWMTISDDTYVADLLRLAGGLNAFGREPDRYPTMAPRAAAERGVQVHFFPSEPYPFDERRHGELARAAFGDDAERLFVPGDDYCWHGFRTLAGLERMRELKTRMEG